jgi:RES domain
VLHAISPPGRLHRIGRAPDPWSWPDWAHATADGTFGNRWDDPNGSYRVLYAASDRLGAFIEVLARFRPDPQVEQGIADVAGEDDGALPPGRLPASWLKDRRHGEATVGGSFVEIGHSESLAVLRSDLAARVIHYSLKDLDAAAIRLSAPRRFTQEISRYVQEQTGSSGPKFAGISYLSRLGDELRLWAIFEPTVAVTDLLGAPRIKSISHDDPDFRRALEINRIELIRSS